MHPPALFCALFVGATLVAKPHSANQISHRQTFPTKLSRQHRGHYGSIEASPEDNCLFGKLQFIRALVNYEGTTVAELTQAFREAVDDYLDTCAARGQEVETPCKGSFNVRVGHDLHLAASVAATRDNISLNDLTRRALSTYLERHG